MTSLAIQCNADSAPAKLHASAAAGSTVTLRWTIWPDSHVGPVITYMARCPDTGCQDWTPSASDKVWFKVKEGGREGTSNVWAAVSFLSFIFFLFFSFFFSCSLRSIFTYPWYGKRLIDTDDNEKTPLMTAPANYEYAIPSCLKPGYYLVRHEIIALHSAYSYPGAQFYPGCHQLQVTGSGTKTPSSGLVSFPGAYKSTDPGVTYNAYQGESFFFSFLFLFGKDDECGGEGGEGRGNMKVIANGDVMETAATYTIPGPAVFTC